jgi:hypothetical protein
MDMISSHYRQIQGFADARRENLIRPERVIASAENSGITMNPKGGAVIVKKRDTGPGGERIPAPYTMATHGRGVRRNSEYEDIGSILDLTA